MDFWANSPEDPFDAFFLHAPVLMHAIDAKGTLVKVSRFWAETLGYEPEEMVGRKSVEFLTEESREKAVREVLPEFMANGRIRDVSYQFVKKDGSVLDVLLSATAQYDKQGQFERSLAIIFDNSEAASSKSAQAENQAKSRFLAAMSHEIRTPMNAILGFAQLLRRSNLDNKQVAQLDAIISAGNNLMRLLSDLLDLSRLEAGRMQVIKEPFNLHKLIDEVMDLWHSNAFEKGLRLRCTLDRNVPIRVSSDSGRIRQVLNNFLSNAIKFTQEGSVTLTVEEVSRKGTESVIRFEVTDTGQGLDEDALQKLFIPFVQIDTSQNGNTGGWGLGLSICQHIASLLGAKVSGKGLEGGAGSCFTLEIPLVVVPSYVVPERAAALAGADLPEGPGLSVLVAEDNIMNQDVIESMLVELGHNVTVVSNGFEAINKLQDQNFDLILMDISMPGLDGVGATEQIRAFSGDRRDVPIIAVTGNITSGARELYKSMGMNDYIPKPVSLDDLGRAIYRATSGIG